MELNIAFTKEELKLIKDGLKLASIHSVQDNKSDKLYALYCKILATLSLEKDFKNIDVD